MRRFREPSVTAVSGTRKLHNGVRTVRCDENRVVHFPVLHVREDLLQLDMKHRATREKQHRRK